jgi:XTP/dITP diphosphohydrolase
VAHRATGEAVVADDSGIGATGLGGRPGIHSARYGGEGASDEENLAKLLVEVAAAGDDRRAFYTCALALIDEDGSEHVFEARWDGALIEEPRGSGGFGYDPAFVPDDTGPDDDRTASELSEEEKNAISHRGRAARMLAAHLAARGAARTGR